MFESPFPKTVTLVPGCARALGSTRLAAICAWMQEAAQRGRTPACHLERLPCVLNAAKPGSLSLGRSCRVALMQGWGEEGLTLLDQECSVACQGTAELASARLAPAPFPSLLWLLPSPIVMVTTMTVTANTQGLLCARKSSKHFACNFLEYLHTPGPLPNISRTHPFEITD